MALPSLERSYEFNVNNLHTGVDVAWDNRSMIYNIHAAMTGMTNNPWTIYGSCNGSSYGYPGPGWSGPSDCIWGGETAAQDKSWMIWQLPNGSQVMFACAHNSSGDGWQYYGTLRFSAEGLFGGGGVQSVPSAADQSVHKYRTEYWGTGYTGGGYNARQHFIHSTDGQQSIVIICRAGLAPLTWVIGEVVDPVSGLDLPLFFYDKDGSNDSGEDSAIYTNLCDNGYCSGKVTSTGDATGMFRGSFSTQGIGADLLGQQVPVANDLSGEWPFYRCGFYTYDVSYAGRHGRIADLWLTSTGLNTGDTIEENPAAPTYDFAVFGDLVVPWNGTLPLVA